jgi:hypothetical protein
MARLTKAEKKANLIADLVRLQGSGDTEGQHAEADNLLIAYIDDLDIEFAYDAIEKWYA